MTARHPLAAVLFIAALRPCPAIAQQKTTAPASAPTSAPAERTPPADILAGLETADPERQLEAFTAWHTWRAGLREEQRPGADAFLARPEHVNTLGNIVLYDMTSDERRLTAYKVLARIGGQQVFPYFLWGMTDNDEHGPPGFIQDFFEASGDPTLIEHLPGSIRWQKVIEKINDRWSGHDPPEKKWKPIDPRGFIEALSDRSAARRRLAIRAVTVNRALDRATICPQLRTLLEDSNADVRTAVLESLTITACPDLRGRLKAIAENGREALARRQLALHAVVACNTATEWTAEWMLDSLPGWPAAMDETVKDCLIRLRPKETADRPRYAGFLRDNLSHTHDPRTRAVLEAALKAM